MTALTVLSALAAVATVHGAHSAPTTIYDFKEKDIEGKQVPFDRFRGKVLLIVNTASY